MNTDKRMKVRKLGLSSVYLAPLLILQLNSFLYHISALSAIKLCTDTEESKSINVNNQKKTMIIWFIIGILMNYGCTYIAFFQVIKDNGIKFGDFNFLTRYSMLIPLSLALLWRYKFVLHEKRSKALRTAAIVLLPTIISQILFSIVKPCNLGPKVNYINSFWCSLVLAAFFEEVFFRGFIYCVLKSFCSKKVSIILTAMIFVTSHFNLLYAFIYDDFYNSFWNAIMIFLLSVITCLLYDETDNLITPIVYHAVNNGALFYAISLFAL